MSPLYCLLISYESCCQQMVSLALHNDCKSSWKPLTGLLSSDSRKPLHTHTEIKCWIEHLAFILFLVWHKQTWHNMYAVEQLAVLKLHFWNAGCSLTVGQARESVWSYHLTLGQTANDQFPNVDLFLHLVLTSLGRNSLCILIDAQGKQTGPEMADIAVFARQI